MLEAADLGEMISAEQGLPGELIGDPERKTTERAVRVSLTRVIASSCMTGLHAANTSKSGTTRRRTIRRGRKPVKLPQRHLLSRWATSSMRSSGCTSAILT